MLRLGSLNKLGSQIKQFVSEGHIFGLYDTSRRASSERAVPALTNHREKWGLVNAVLFAVSCGHKYAFQELLRARQGSALLKGKEKFTYQRFISEGSAVQYFDIGQGTKRPVFRDQPRSPNNFLNVIDPAHHEVDSFLPNIERDCIFYSAESIDNRSSQSRDTLFDGTLNYALLYMTAIADADHQDIDFAYVVHTSFDIVHSTVADRNRDILLKELTARNIPVHDTWVPRHDFEHACLASTSQQRIISPVYYAALHGWTDLLRVLFEHGAGTQYPLPLDGTVMKWFLRQPEHLSHKKEPRWDFDAQLLSKAVAPLMPWIHKTKGRPPYEILEPSTHVYDRIYTLLNVASRDSTVPAESIITLDDIRYITRFHHLLGGDVHFNREKGKLDWLRMSREIQNSEERLWRAIVKADNSRTLKLREQAKISLLLIDAAWKRNVWAARAVIELGFPVNPTSNLMPWYGLPATRPLDMVRWTIAIGDNEITEGARSLLVENAAINRILKNEGAVSGWEYCIEWQYFFLFVRALVTLPRVLPVPLAISWFGFTVWFIPTMRFFWQVTTHGARNQHFVAGIEALLSIFTAEMGCWGFLVFLCVERALRVNDWRTHLPLSIFLVGFFRNFVLAVLLSANQDASEEETVPRLQYFALVWMDTYFVVFIINFFLISACVWGYVCQWAGFVDLWTARIEHLARYNHGASYEYFWRSTYSARKRIMDGSSPVMNFTTAREYWTKWQCTLSNKYQRYRSRIHHTTTHLY